MKAGKAPLRTFGDLMQFYQTKSEPEPKPEKAPKPRAVGGKPQTSPPESSKEPMETLAASETPPAVVAESSVIESSVVETPVSVAETPVTQGSPEGLDVASDVVDQPVPPIDPETSGG
jgi:hypothetical protein